MMIDPSIDELLKAIATDKDGILHEELENKYVLALVSAKRARELNDGEPGLIPGEYANHVSEAVEEIAQGKVKCHMVPVEP